MESKMATRNILVSIGVERLRNRAFSLINEEVFTTGLNVHLWRLAMNLKKIQGLLPDAEGKGTASEIVRTWLKRVAVVSSQTDTLLNECSYQNSRFKSEVEGKKPEPGKVLNFLSSSKNIAVRKKMICKTKGINSKFENLFRESVILGLIPVEIKVEFEGTGETSDSSMTGTFGMRKDLQGVRDLLINSGNNQDLSVISIVGKERVGKTTLAKLVYKDGMVGKFDERIWICVSGEFDIVNILKDMYGKLTASVCDVSHREAITCKLIERLKGRKLFLVLDGVSLTKEDALKWDSFVRLLQRVGISRGSKILVTAREFQVSTSVLPHELTDRRFADKLALKGGASKAPRLVEMSKKIVARCGGIPLLVKLRGNLIYSKKDEIEWLKIAQDEVWHQVQDVLEGPMADIMKLCYDLLPSLPLKQCFAFCSVFPRDTVIQKEELTLLWMAQGLLSPSGGSHPNMEHTGANYFDILLRHSFLQDFEDDEFHKRKWCKIPCLLHNLAVLISKGFCSIMEDIEVKDDFKAVHVTMINCTLQLSKDLRDSFRKLRTLRLINSGVLGDILPYTKYLCALTVVNIEVEELPSSIGKLEHLKLLDISRTRIVKLPDSITKLYSLETLRLYDLQELPKNFSNLVSLRHFYVETFEDLGKLNFLPQRFQDLIKHSSFKASFKACLSNEFRIEQLASLEHPDRYSSLKIYRLENVKDKEEASKAELSRMTMIDYLKLHWSGRRENNDDENVLEGLKPHTNMRRLVVENFKGSKFPSWMVTSIEPLLHNLVSMELEDCCLCEKIPPLGHLPCLQVIKIQGMDNIKHIGPEFYGLTVSDSASTSSGSVFPALRELTLKRLTSLEKWSGIEHLLNKSSAFLKLEKFEVERCPKLTCLPDILNSDHKYLQRLEIAFCDNLTSLPTGLQNLESLQDLEIRGLPSLSELSIRCSKNLTSLTIGDFSGASDIDNNVHNALESHIFLHLKGGGGHLTSLPDKLQHFSKLRYLTIWGYDGLKALPDWLASFQSLQTLKLEFCRSLMFFPSAETLKQLKVLDEISISFCPLLVERCSRGSRQEWHKISHIRQIVINNGAIKSQN